MTIDAARIEKVIAGARARAARTGAPGALLETEGLELLEALGIPAPAHVFVRGAREAASVDTSALAGDKVVVKVVSPLILHKSDVGGVKVVEHRREAITAAISDMEARLADRQIAGFTINRFERYDPTLGSELILGLRWTADFGAVVTLGAGGIHAEFLAAHFRPGREIGVFSPEVTTNGDIRAALGETRAARPSVGHAPAAQPPGRELWRRLTLAPGVELHVASGVRLPSPAKLQELANWWNHAGEDRDD